MHLTVIPMILLGLATIGCQRAPDLALYGKLEAAQKAFDAAESPDDFRLAAALYQEILDSGIASGMVLYNQGNAFVRAGMRGRAIACYRQAIRYRPRDPYLEANLQYAERGAAGGTRSKPLVEYVLFWQDWVSYPEKFRLSMACATMTFGIAAFGVLWQRPNLKRGSLAFLLITMLLMLSAIYDWHRFIYTRRGVVVDDSVVARKGDAESYEPAFSKPLEEATEFTLVDGRGDWILIRLAEDQEGWIPREAAVVY